MKIIKKKIGDIALLVGFGVAISSCTLDIPPVDQYSDPGAISTVYDARAYLADIYASYPHIQYDLSLLGNDFCPTHLSSKNINDRNFYFWRQKEIKEFSDPMWMSYYNVIANLDALDERIINVEPITEEDSKKKIQIIAEMNALKAMAYFTVLRLYAPVYHKNEEKKGIIIKSLFGVEFNKRETIEFCATYIQTLLDLAELNIKNQKAYGWLGLDAVRYLKAELALYKGEYEVALDLSNKILANAPDQISENDLESMWLRANQNVIFAFQYSHSYYTILEYDQKLGDYFALNGDLVLAEGDYRRSSYNYIFDESGVERVLLGKYNGANKKQTKIFYIDMIRYSGAYFIASESLARLNREDEAINMINRYLVKVNANKISGFSGEKLIDVILKEKYKEFAGEGRNFFDLKRNEKGISKKNTWSRGTFNFGSTDYRWTFRIPPTEYKHNPVMQNNGW